MKIYKAKHSGFCFGVKRAIQITQKTLVNAKNVYIQGDLIHNEIVGRQLEGAGLKRVHSLDEAPCGAILIIKAHGQPRKTYQQAKTKNLHIIDATCPMVTDIHRRAKELESKGYQVVIIGDRNHEETIGILGNVHAGLVVEGKKDVEKLKNQLKKKIGIVCQSTQDMENVSEIVAELTRVVEELLFINTRCQQTRLRQDEIKRIALEADAVLIVGSKTSANTKRLYQLAKKINKNTLWIDEPKEINAQKLARYKSVGIIGGASTPGEVLDEICAKLK